MAKRKLGPAEGKAEQASTALVRVSPKHGDQLIQHGRQAIAATLVEQEPEPPLSERLAPYRTLFSPKDRLESSMYHAINFLCDEIEQDPGLSSVVADGDAARRQLRGQDARSLHPHDDR